MNVIDRVRNILVRPKVEWPIIAAEPATPPSLFSGYAAIVALLPVIGLVLAVLLWSYGHGLFFVLVSALVSYVIGLAMLYVIALVADALAPGFDGVKGQVQALKLVIYSATPLWVAGFFGFLGRFGTLLTFAGFLYAGYLLYLGAQATMRVPEAKAPAYTAVLVLLWILLWMLVVGAVVSFVVGTFVGGVMSGAYMG